GNWNSTGGGNWNSTGGGNWNSTGGGNWNSTGGRNVNSSTGGGVGSGPAGGMGGNQSANGSATAGGLSTAFSAGTDQGSSGFDTLDPTQMNSLLNSLKNSAKNPSTSMLHEASGLTIKLDLSSLHLGNMKQEVVDGNIVVTGQVVVYDILRQQNSSVCKDSDWSEEEAMVVCKILFGQTSQVVVEDAQPTSEFYNDPSIPEVKLDKFQCHGDESDLLMCTHRWDTDQCKVKELAGVKCVLGKQDSVQANQY
ncbi:hypothetical protein OTU49_008124, partial [Cherax quadricarinatus]